MAYSLRILAYRLLALCLLIFLWPVMGILAIIVKRDSKGPFLFKQKRMGRYNNPFVMYKIRTMRNNALLKQKDLLKQNEADGPVFKIRNDPRYTRIGKFLSHTGLDELPQFYNVVRGEMSLVGPRPLPVEEARRVPKQYRERFLVLPGMTSDWIVEGSHKLSFKKWMGLDVDYARNHSLKKDMEILAKTVSLILRLLVKR